MKKLHSLGLLGLREAQISKYRTWAALLFGRLRITNTLGPLEIYTGTHFDSAEIARRRGGERREEKRIGADVWERREKE